MRFSTGNQPTFFTEGNKGIIVLELRSGYFAFGTEIVGRKVCMRTGMNAVGKREFLPLLRL